MKKLLCSLILTLTTIGFVQAQQEIDVQGNGISIIGDGSNTPLVSDDTDFGQITTGSAVEHIFTILNTGTTNLTVNPSFIGASSDFTITTAAVSPIPPSGSTTIGVTFTAPVALGVYNAQLIIFNNDPNENPYQINIRGESVAPVGPEIDILGNGISIIGDGTNTPLISDNTNYGQVLTGNTLEHIFTIQNTGTTNLSVNPAFIGGSSDFTITTPAVSPVLPSGSTTIGITFTAPVALGTYNATLFLSNDDVDENPYQINIQAESVAPSAPEINVLGNGISIIGDGTNTPNVADDTDYGQVAASTAVEHIFTIENTGNVNLTVNPSFIGGSSDFTITTPAVSPVAPLGSTTIGVTFTAPAAVGVYNAQLIIFNGDSDENPYTINIQGESVVLAAPEINVLGNGISIIGDGTNTPNVADDTDYGQVGIGTPVEHLFTIQNTGTANLTVSSTFIGGSADFTITTAATSPILPGQSTVVGVTYNSPDVGVDLATLIIVNDDSDENPYQINLRGEGLALEPEMDVFGNGVEIVDGDTTPSVTDDTDYGQVDVTSGSVINTFTIENNGAADLNLTDPSPFVSISGAHAGDFTISAVPSSLITATNSTTFQITFNPSAVGIRTATITIANDDVDEDPYNFDIQGEGIDANVGNPLLITQYFEGTDASNNWIEVKNISQDATLTNAYHLALFEDLEGTTSGFISTSPPTISVAIPPLAAGEVVLFRRSGASLTNFVNTVTVVDTEVCRFNGNDVILISSSNGSNCYNNRSDIMGIVGDQQAITWAVDIALIKGCGTSEVPTIVYDPTNITYDASQYIQLTLNEVDAADLATNVALGRQTVGPTIWTSSWDNDIPDKTKNAIINGTYNESNGSFDSCNLTVNSGSIINFNSGGSGSNYILVENDLTVNGSFIIGDTESLVTVNPDATMSGNISKIEVTTTLNNFRDITYWSSPVNTSIGQAFAGVDPTRIFKWDIPSTSPDFWGDWSLASGTMTSARGYISEAPSGTPDGGTHTVTFTGTPNNGTKGIVVGWNNDGIGDSDFNLIGNPYPSAINIDDFIQSVSNNDIDGTIWLWTHNTAIDIVSGQFLGLDYATYNLTGGILAAPSGGPVPTSNIGSGQGFFVKSVSGGPVFFENTMRLQGQNSQFFRAPDTKSTANQEKDRVWLNVESKTGGAFNQILVGFFDNATDGYDRGYDGTRLGASWINFYSKIEDTYYAVQGLSSFNVDKKVSLGFDTYIPDAMSYKISIFNIEGALNDNDLYLVDNELGITHDLKLADYEFDVNGEGNFPDRFTLQFNKSTLGVDDLELNNNFVVMNEENELQLKSSSIITSLKVYDMMGRLLIDTKPNESQFNISTQNIKKGTILILNATFDNGAELSKKAIRY